MQEAISLERSLEEWPLELSPTFLYDLSPTVILGHQLWWSADVDGARAIFEDRLGAVRARNDPFGEADALWYLGLLEWRAGNWEEADRYAADSLDIATQLDHVTPSGDLPGTVIAAHRGRIDDARVRAQDAIVHAEAEGIRIAQSGPVLGARLRRALARRRRSGSAVSPTLL